MRVHLSGGGLHVSVPPGSLCGEALRWVTFILSLSTHAHTCTHAHHTLRRACVRRSGHRWLGRRHYSSRPCVSCSSELQKQNGQPSPWWNDRARHPCLVTHRTCQPGFAIPLHYPLCKICFSFASRFPSSSSSRFFLRNRLSLWLKAEHRR